MGSDRLADVLTWTVLGVLSVLIGLLTYWAGKSYLRRYAYHLTETPRTWMQRLMRFHVSQVRTGTLVGAIMFIAIGIVCFILALLGVRPR